MPGQSLSEKRSQLLRGNARILTRHNKRRQMFVSLILASNYCGFTNCLVLAKHRLDLTQLNAIPANFDLAVDASAVGQSRMQFDLLLQVRNKLLDAYQELMRMQV